MTSALFVALVLPALAAVHYYAWRRVVRDTTAPGSWPRRAGTALLVVLGLLLVAAPPAESALPKPLAVAIGWPGFLWMAGILYLSLALLVTEAVRPLLLRALHRRSGSDPDPSRRLFVSRSLALAAGAATAATVGYGAATALGPPTVKHLTVPLARLDPRADGFRIAVVSDIHLNSLVGRARARQITELVNGTRPDLIAVVGDLVEDADVAELGPEVAPIAGLSAPHGVYFVTGNHEHYSGGQQWIDFVRRLGLRPLVNERVPLPGFDLAGVNDASGTDEGLGPDYEAALGGRDPGRAVVLLAHQPVQVHEAVKHGVDLQLSGHTHGGQLWPFNHLAGLANPAVAGLHRFGGTLLYVTRGTGFWGPPVRLGADPDVTVVTLAVPRS
ncbi:metallophosphoesterase [Kitasatospora sp. NPDC093558]|uniref:metallophosphoesterase n=1 Tax=Kitasatospora sp. NPDC093558 TaxID=3155201 RepID=UPI00343CC3A4